MNANVVVTAPDAGDEEVSNGGAQHQASRWERFWFARFDPVGVGVFRIALGFLMLVLYTILLPNWERFYAADGIISARAPDFLNADHDRWTLFYWTHGIIPMQCFWGLGWTCALCFLLGLWTRPVTVILYLLQVSMVHQNRWVTNGEDLVVRMLLFYACFSPLGFTLSLDALRRSRRKAPSQALPSIWPVRLMQVNVALIYAISLPYKLADDVAWSNGWALYWTMANPNWSAFPWPQLFYQWGGLLSSLATQVTVFVEAGFPILVWFPKLRLYAVVVMMAFHLGIAVVMPNVRFFSLAMVCALLVFLPPEWVRSWKLPAITVWHRVPQPSANRAGAP